MSQILFLFSILPRSLSRVHTAPEIQVCCFKIIHYKNTVVDFPSIVNNSNDFTHIVLYFNFPFLKDFCPINAWVVKIFDRFLSLSLPLFPFLCVSIYSLILNLIYHFYSVSTDTYIYIACFHCKPNLHWKFINFAFHVIVHTL